ncbi:Pre-mRNA-splicing factor CWC21 [Candida viswanathii]|uniref:Pre-mRNA-splicing factor CWC21 n=1 Tax=Candida viswanathii TaxID=5486 RepID=A0A367YDG7_9ASCO|nr:Pre-mRNA-splicing factor CWC21 [Candida viswanathii]
MSYNGIGLQSVRGSSTSGHVQKSLSSKVSKPGFHESRKKKSHDAQLATKLKNTTKEKAVDEEIGKELKDHESLRKIEVRCMDLRDKLEDDDDELDDEEIDKRVNELREKLTKELKEGKGKYEYKRLYKEDDNKPRRK